MFFLCYDLSSDIMKKKIILIVIIVLLIVIGILTYLGFYFGIIPVKKYSNKDFGISNYVSKIDKDNDGIDYKTYILENAKKYISTKPKYKIKYYITGYPNDEYGVCTDVVAYALLNSGYDLMELVNADILENRSSYNIDVVDKNIDFRRVRNLKIYFEHTTISLTTDIEKIQEWQGGDIVIFPSHIGIVSDVRNKKGIPYVIHHANPYQLRYEEDILEKKEVVGHFRIT